MGAGACLDLLLGLLMVWVRLVFFFFSLLFLDFNDNS